MVSKEPCSRRPGLWDLDRGGYDDWTQAITVCVQACPLLATCQRSLREAAARDGHGPLGVIQAGVAFGDTGRPLSPTALRRRESTRANEQRRDGAETQPLRMNTIRRMARVQRYEELQRQGLSGEQLAAAMNTTVGAVRRFANRARRDGLLPRVTDRAA